MSHVWIEFVSLVGDSLFGHVTAAFQSSDILPRLDRPPLTYEFALP